MALSGPGLIHRVRTSQRTQCASIIKTNEKMLYREVMSVNSRSDTGQIKMYCKNAESFSVKPGDTCNNHLA